MFKLPHGPGEGSLGALIPESWLRRTQTLGAFRGGLKQPPHLSTSAILTHASSLLPPPLCLHPWWPPRRAVSRPKELTPAPRCCWRMNQSQRMAPVGTDKELSDLLDFSMVSDPTHPSCSPSSPRPQDYGKKPLPETPPVSGPQTCLGQRTPGGAGGFGELPMDGLTPLQQGTASGHLSPNCMPWHRVGPAHSFTDGETKAQSKGGAAQGLQFLLAEAPP